MEKRVYLHVPELSELWYRKQLMSDLETMSYNKGYDEYEGYDKETGCIEFPKEDWNAWYDYFINREPQRFYAYVVRKSDGAFIGEVNLHKSDENDWHEMGIVIEAKYRGQGYSTEALKLLVEYGFEKMGTVAVHNVFETERKAAIHTHFSAGFSQYAMHDNMVELIITSEQYKGK